MGRESDSGATLTGARAAALLQGGVDAYGERRCAATRRSTRGGEGFLDGRRGRMGKNSPFPLF